MSTCFRGVATLVVMFLGCWIFWKHWPDKVNLWQSRNALYSNFPHPPVKFPKTKFLLKTYLHLKERKNDQDRCNTSTILYSQWVEHGVHQEHLNLLITTYFIYLLQSWMCHCHRISQLPQFHSSTLTSTANSRISLLKILIITWFARKNSWAQSWQSVQQKLMILNFVQYTWDSTPYKQSL